MKRRFTILTAAIALLVGLAFPMGMRGQTKITDYSNIVSGNTYYIGATTGGTDYYLYVYHNYNSTSVAGTAQTSMNDASTFVFEGSGTSWTIKFDNGKYLSLKDTKDNGKVQVVADPATFTTSNQSGKIRLSKGNFSVQKNNSGTQFGSYGNTQTDIWLMEVPSGLALTTVTIDDSGITNTDVYTSTAAGSLSATVTENTNNTVISGATVTWSSSNEAVATIASDGSVTLVAEGITTITASYAGVSGQYGESSATYELTVSDSTPFAGGDVTFVAGIDLGSTTSNADGDQMTKKVVTVSSTSAAFATAEYRLYSGSETTISTSFGTITQIEFTKNGNYSLGNLSTETGNYTSTTGIWTGDAQEVTFSAAAQVRLDQINVTITAPSSAIATTTEITVPSGFNTDLNVSTTAGTLSASVTETESGNAVSGATVTWSSSNTDVATIDANGVVTLVAAGTTTIIASYAGVTDQYRPSSDTYELVVTDSTPIADLVIDFESTTTAYTNWTFTNMTSQQTGSITAHGGDYYGTTGSKTSASITTNSKIATPYTLTCYVSKQSTNTAASTWYIQVSSDGTTWTDVASRSAIDMNKGEWKEFSANLTEYTDVYVRVYYNGNSSTAVRNIDDLTLLTSEPSVIPPTFSPAEGFYTSAQNVTISTTTSGATIYYTLDGTDPTTSSSVYSSPINVSSTTTIKAMAVASGNESSIVSATYTIELPLSTMDQIFAKATEVGSTATTVHITLGDWVVTGANTSSHTFVSDGTKGFMIYGSNHGFSAGDILSGTVECKVQLYNGAAEITQLNSTTTGLIVTTGGTASVANIAMANLTGINTGALVSYQNLICEERVEGDYTNYYLSDGTTEIQAYKTLLNDYADYLEDGKTYNITGVFVLNNETKRINPRSADDIVEVPVTETHTLDIEGYGDTQNPGGWYLIASPIGNVAPTNVAIEGIDNANMVSGTFDLFYFDHTKDNEWVNYKRNESGEGNASTDPGFNLISGKGYLYANSEDVTLVFTGTAPTDEEVEVTLDYNANAEMPGWNLVGNPFAVTANITTQEGHTLYFYTLNAAGDEFVAATNTTIDPMEGVFVEAKVANEKITFTRGESAKGSLVALNLSNGRNIIDRAIVRFNECRPLHKLQLNKNHSKVYISMEGEDYAVVRGEEMGAMPVNFKAENNGTYTLNVSGQNTEFAYLHLIDNMTGNDVDLLQTPSYSFEAKTTDYESRFKLVFATGDNSNDDNFAFYSNGSFVINNEGNAELQVIDIMGRIVKSESINGCANVSVNGAAGVYMLRLVNGDNVKTQKVVVK